MVHHFQGQMISLQLLFGFCSICFHLIGLEILSQTFRGPLSQFRHYAYNLELPQKECGTNTGTIRLSPQ